MYAVVKKGASRNSQVIDYVLGSGTDTLVFKYEVDINDEDTDGVSIHLPGNLNIKASGTNIAYQSDPSGEIPVLENQSGYKIDGSLVANDTTPPTISTVRLADRLGAEQDAAYEAGDWIGVEVRFSEGVIAVGEIRLVDGTFQYLFPQLELDIGGVARFSEVGHLSGDDGNYHQVPSLTLVFGYTVQEGDVDENDLVIAHPDGSLVGLDLKGPLGTDANGYDFGLEMLSADEDGRWVSYVYGNPETRPIGTAFGELQLKNTWVVRHDGLLFGSGWYVDADEFTKSFVAAAVSKFHAVGLEGIVEYFTGSESDFAGLAAAIDYYNSIETVEGKWSAFIVDGSGKIVDHYDKELLGRDLEDLFGVAMFEASEEGNWVTTESLRVWVVSYDGMTFGSDWYHDETN